MRVNDVAVLLGTTPDTVRFYTRRRYLRPVKNAQNGYKEYRPEDVRRLRFIINARELGFSVEEIGSIVGEAEKGRTPCPLVRRLIQAHLVETERRFAEVQALRDRLREAVREWEDRPDRNPTGDMVCHLIEGDDTRAR